MSPLLFLDWDGVLVDSLKIYYHLFRKLCQEYDRDFPIADELAFRAWYRADWKINFLELGFSEQEYLDFTEAYPADLSYSEAGYFPGIPELLRSLSESHRLVVVSTAPTLSITSHLEATGLLEHFLEVTGSDDGSTDKIARLAHLKEKHGGNHGIMVGDTELDIEAGKANHLLTVGVTYGWVTEDRIKQAAPDYLVERPSELEPTLKKALRRCAVGSR